MSSSSEMPALSGLQTDYFQLVQSALYHADGMWGDATVDLYLRDLPPSRGYVIAAGVQEAVDAILALQFTDDDLDWMRSMPMYAGLGSTFFESLRHFSFTGTILAVEDGTAVFAREPIVRITAPLPQVGLFEMLLSQRIGAASAVATNAKRLVSAAGGRAILDFGTRRVTGHELSELAARAAHIGGAVGTTHALAARRLSIPAVGLISDTMLAAYEDVGVAYDALSSHFPDGCHLNLPTEAPLDGIDRFSHIQEHVKTVRIDAPDLLSLSRSVRARLDQQGMHHTRILGSGALDEHRIQSLVTQQAPIDLFAVGHALTEGITSGGLDLCYRMAALVRGTTPVPIRGHWSSHWPSVKQVFRFADHDVVCGEVEAAEQEERGGTALLHPWVERGRRVREPSSVREQQRHCARSVAALPRGVSLLRPTAAYSVHASETLQRMRD
ncbi:MAG: hypothetical protein VX127_17000 [Myxococcota bacterium]|nr:hypothetical protein [Myxococcota bacterium]